MKENKDSRIEIRLPLHLKESFQAIAKSKNTTMSKMIQSYILSVIKEEDKNGIQI